MSFCLYCRREDNYVKISTPRTFFIRGTKVEYEELSAHCSTCKRELYVPELHDLNCVEREKAYKRVVELIEGEH